MKTLLPLLAALALFVASPAYADGYGMTGLTISSWENLDNNVGGMAEGGWTNGDWFLGVNVGTTVRNDDETASVSVKAMYAFLDGAWHPVVRGGLGYTGDDQFDAGIGAGLMYDINDSMFVLVTGGVGVQSDDLPDLLKVNGYAEMDYQEYLLTFGVKF